MKLTSLFALTLSLASLKAAGWPHFLGPDRDGTSAETDLFKKFPKDGPPILWEAELHEGFGGAAVVGNEVFIVDRVMKEKDILLCLDLATGKEKWHFENPSEGEPSFPGSRSVPTVEDDAVYFIGSFGQSFRINRKTHKPDWILDMHKRYPDAETPKWGYAQCALITGDILILTPFGTETGIVGIDKQTGKEVWKSGPVGNTHSSPTMMNFGGQDQVVIITTKGGIHSYDPKTGKKLWSSALYENRIPITPPKQIDENRIFATGGYDCGSKMLSIKKTGDSYELDTLWETKKGSQVHPAHLIDGHLYFLANENSNYKTKTKRAKGGLVCFDLDGKELWSTGNEPFMGRGSSIYADGMLIIQDGEKGTLRLVGPSPKGFKLLAEANIFGSDLENKKDLNYWSNLALSNGHLLMRGQDRLLCVQLKK
ncbi:PQQ-like beta-propeller repeat protein [Akkermansiaceae bacterium]|nr:PQQ-like beta-propeller repeat protein [Akkermansiaceae bacterium]MDA9337583.1 PQQ-like beta-propeller repeat protein [bacterium]MDA7519276.1 PQQ-like beta-propeller repeat protein [Akkermansiaceae bacterium]MDA7675005.1 PQQ-like beta-propeller repeat protein [Akkermansiaceae bacterium]MDA7862145.1 PQQ-like beta-propeller repeat protein [Akkermansiaceae bacterium]